LSLIAFYKEKTNGTLHIMADCSVSDGGFSLAAHTPKLCSLQDEKGNHIVTFASVGSAVQQNVLEKICFSNTPLLKEEELDKLYCSKDYKRLIKLVAFDIIEIYKELIEEILEESEERGELLIALKGEIFSVDAKYAVIDPIAPYYVLGSPSEIVIGSIATKLEEQVETEPTGQQVRKLLNEAFMIGKQFYQGSILTPFTYVVQKGKPHEPFLKVVS